MRIVELGKYYPGPGADAKELGGIESHTWSCCQELASEYDVSVLVASNGIRTVRENVDGIPVVRIGRIGKIASQDIVPGMLWWIRKLKPDLIHMHAPNAVATMVCLLAAPDTPVVVTHHLDIVRQRYLRHLVLPFYRRLLDRSAGIIAFTRRYAESSNELRPWVSKVRIIPHGLDESVFAETPATLRRARELRQQYAGDRPMIAFLGRHVHYKGIDDLVRAMVDLPDVVAVIAGDGPLREGHKRLARELGLTGRVHFPGRIPDEAQPALYRAADVFVLPCNSRAEAFGIVQVEAQLSHCPVITSDIESGTTEVTIDGETGLLVPPRDPAALAGAVRKLVDDPDLRRRLGESGYRRAMSAYVASVTGPKLRSYFREIAGQCGLS